MNVYHVYLGNPEDPFHTLLGILKPREESRGKAGAYQFMQLGYLEVCTQTRRVCSCNPYLKNPNESASKSVFGTSTTCLQHSGTESS
jgi:hypothetical protein